jgi:hypothetical protein
MSTSGWKKAVMAASFIAVGLSYTRPAPAAEEVRTAGAAGQARNAGVETPSVEGGKPENNGNAAPVTQAGDAGQSRPAGVVAPQPEGALGLPHPNDGNGAAVDAGKPVNGVSTAPTLQTGGAAGQPQPGAGASLQQPSGAPPLADIVKPESGGVPGPAVQAGGSPGQAQPGGAVGQPQPGGTAVQPQAGNGNGAPADAGKPGNTGNAAPSAQTGRDPFSATGKLATQKDAPVQTPAGIVFTPKEQGKIPRMTMRGHLQGKNGEVIALLEIDKGGVYMVREGDTVGLNDLGVNSVIRVKEISRLHLVIESGSLGQLFIVR